MHHRLVPLCFACSALIFASAFGCSDHGSNDSAGGFGGVDTSSGGTTSSASGASPGDGGDSADGNSAGGTTQTGGSSQGSGGTSGDPQDCTFQSDASLAKAEPAKFAGATAAHNEWRWRVGVPRVKWNAELAKGAQEYADSCPNQHSSNKYRQNQAGFNQVGENLFSGTNLLQGIALWAAERKIYEFGAPSGENFQQVGHYTQITWESTTEIGCGVSNCGQWRTVCWYGPAGNNTKKAPYGVSQGACLDLDNDDVFQQDDADDTDRSVQ